MCPDRSRRIEMADARWCRLRMPHVASSQTGRLRLPRGSFFLSCGSPESPRTPDLLTPVFACLRTYHFRCATWSCRQTLPSGGSAAKARGGLRDGQGPPVRSAASLLQKPNSPVRCPAASSSPNSPSSSPDAIGHALSLWLDGRSSKRSSSPFISIALCHPMLASPKKTTPVRPSRRLIIRGGATGLADTLALPLLDPSVDRSRENSACPPSLKNSVLDFS